MLRISALSSATTTRGADVDCGIAAGSGSSG
jgi:hypothetical protein